MLVVEGAFGYKSGLEFAGGLAQAQYCAVLNSLEI